MFIYFCSFSFAFNLCECYKCFTIFKITIGEYEFYPLGTWTLAGILMQTKGNFPSDFKASMS